MKRILMMLLIASAFFVSLARTQRAQWPIWPRPPVIKPLVLYDDFNGRWIDPAKWDNWGDLEGVRHAVIDLVPPYQWEGNNRRLRIFQRANSMAIGDTEVRYGWLALQTTNPASIREISFHITVKSVAITGCPSNPNAGGAWAGFVGRFFNYGGEGYGDETDVEAAIDLSPEGTEAGAPMRVTAKVAAGDGTVSDWQILGFVPLGQTARLRVKWDQPNHQFIFQLNKDAEVYSLYSVPDTSAPVIALRGLWVGRGTPDCTATPSGSTMMDAYFDNVYVNAP